MTKNNLTDLTDYYSVPVKGGSTTRKSKTNKRILSENILNDKKDKKNNVDENKEDDKKDKKDKVDNVDNVDEEEDKEEDKEDNENKNKSNNELIGNLQNKHKEIRQSKEPNKKLSDYIADNDNKDNNDNKDIKSQEEEHLKISTLTNKRNKKIITPIYDIFPLILKDNIGKELDNFKNYGLREHQHIVKNYMMGKLTDFKPRGILLYHMMGTGKTLCMISAAVSIGKPILCLMSKSLFNNFHIGIEIYNKKFKTNVTNKFTFISLDAYNFMDQIYRKIGPTLEGITVVIDEVHELLSQIINADNKNSPRFYDLVMHSNNCNFIFGSGTPLIKDPFEIVPCVNMLSGRNILPTSYDDFNSLFNPENELFSNDSQDSHDIKLKKINLTEIKNSNILQNRLFGIISYVTNNPKLFPRRLPTIIEKIPMISKQLTAYRIARETEIKESEKSSKFKKDSLPTIGQKMGKTKFLSYSTYRQRSRALCNGYYDEENDLFESPKIDKLYNNIKDRKGKGIVYSQFKEHGIYKIANRLKAEGWTNSWNESTTFKKHINKNIIQDIESDIKRVTKTVNIKGGTFDDDSDSILNHEVYRRMEFEDNEGDNEGDNEEDNEEDNEDVKYKYGGKDNIINVNNEEEFIKVTHKKYLNSNKISNINKEEDKEDKEDKEDINHEEVDIDNETLTDLDHKRKIKVDKEVEVEDEEYKIIKPIIEEDLDVVENDVIEELKEIENGDIIYEGRSYDKGKVVEGDTITFKGTKYKRGTTSKTYAILDGDVPIETRKKIMEVYNSPDNLDGQLLCMLLVTTVGSRGISLIACKHSHYFEPYWYLFRLLQFETRAIRDGSHLMLPEEEQEVQLFIYLSTLPELATDTESLTVTTKNSYEMEAKDKAINEKESTDEVLYYRSVHRQAQLDKFLDIMKEVSIECPHVNKMAHLDDTNSIKINCKLCSPIGNTLYTDNIFDDVTRSSPCVQLKEETIETKLITYNNEEYGYSTDNDDAESSIFNIAFYRYDDLLKNYVKLEENTELFSNLFDLVNKN